MAEVNPRRLAQVNLSRVKHREQVFAATPETVLHLGDVVVAVGPAEELDEEERKMLHEQADSLQKQINEEYRNDREMQIAIRNEVFACEAELEKIGGEEYEDFDGD